MSKITSSTESGRACVYLPADGVEIDKTTKESMAGVCEVRRICDRRGRQPCLLRADDPAAAASSLYSLHALCILGQAANEKRRKGDKTTRMPILQIGHHYKQLHWWQYQLYEIAKISSPGRHNSIQVAKIIQSIKLNQRWTRRTIKFISSINQTRNKSKPYQYLQTTNNSKVSWSSKTFVKKMSQSFRTRYRLWRRSTCRCSRGRRNAIQPGDFLPKITNFAILRRQFLSLLAISENWSSHRPIRWKDLPTDLSLRSATRSLGFFWSFGRRLVTTSSRRPTKRDTSWRRSRDNVHRCQSLRRRRRTSTRLGASLTRTP